MSDCDGDGLSNLEELGNNTDPFDSDTDGDGVPDNLDAFPNDNMESIDADGDGVGANSDFDDTDPFVTNAPFTVVVGDSFTPNGDGLNDFWEIEGISAFPGHSISVINRYGHEVFASTNYNNDWDGFYRKENRKLPPGSYYYQVILDNGQIFTGWLFINY